MLSNAICAERAALGQLLLRPNVERVTAVFIVTDAPTAITPGTLCREFLCSHVNLDVPIIMGPITQPMRTTLGLLYPYPCVYARRTRQECLTLGQDLVLCSLPSLAPDEEALYRAVWGQTAQDARDHVHPLRYGAGVLFQDGTQALSWQHKTVEYGASMDAVCKLIPFIEQHQAAPKLLLQVDHFGRLHAPFAAARAYFAEYFGAISIQTIIHDEAGETLTRLALAELVPNPPEIECS